MTFDCHSEVRGESKDTSSDLILYFMQYYIQSNLSKQNVWSLKVYYD